MTKTRYRQMCVNLCLRRRSRRRMPVMILHSLQTYVTHAHCQTLRPRELEKTEVPVLKCWIWGTLSTSINL